MISDLRKLYRGLSPAGRRAVWMLLAAEAVLITAAEVDIQRRPSDRIRGPKLLWRLVATQNVVGPAAYFGLARKPMVHQSPGIRRARLALKRR